MNIAPFTHIINGVHFIVEESEPGIWFWTNGISESKRDLDSQAEALEEAMRWVREWTEEERQRHEADAYRSEANQFFDRRDYQ